MLRMIYIYIYIYLLWNWQLCKDLQIGVTPFPSIGLGRRTTTTTTTGHPVPVSSLGLKCPDCCTWNCSYIVYPSKMKRPFRDNCLMYVYLRLAFLIAGCLVLIAGTAIEQAPSVGPHHSVCLPRPSNELTMLKHYIYHFCLH